MSGSVVHIAGVQVTIGPHLRQRCSWCGATLIDYALHHLAVPVGQDPMPATWPVGGLVLIDGALATVVPHEDGAPLPENACGRIDPEITA